ESIKDFQLVGIFILVITITLVVGVIFLGRIDLKYFKERKNIGEKPSKTMFALTISSYILIAFFIIVITVGILSNVIVDGFVDEYVEEHIEEEKKVKSEDGIEYDILSNHEGEAEVTFVGEDDEVITDKAKLGVHGGDEPYVEYKGVFVDMDKVVPHHVLTDEEDIKKTVYKDIKLYLPK